MLATGRFEAGRKNCQVWEVNGEKGSIHFNKQRLGELEVFWVAERKETLGFHDVLGTEPYHP